MTPSFITVTSSRGWPLQECLKVFLFHHSLANFVNSAVIHSIDSCSFFSSNVHTISNCHFFTHPPHHHSKSIIIHYPPHPVLTPHIHLICSSYLLLLFIIVHHSKSMSHVNHYPPHPFLTPHIHLMCSSYLLRLFMIAVHHSKSMTHAYDKSFEGKTFISFFTSKPMVLSLKFW